MKCPNSIAVAGRPNRRGIALVITLLMLAVVTITAVAFLAVSRREREAVATNAEQIDARYIAEIGVQHAVGRVASRIAAVTNRMAYGGYFVSTNFANPYFRLDSASSFLERRDYRQLTNVSYYRNTNYALFDLTQAGHREDYARMLGNLYYDPRPPVFIQTNRNPNLPLDFRFYLDLNRNSQFETNGLIVEQDRQGQALSLDPRFYWGDPEWIGVLEHPDVPHSGTNHFIGRTAYVVIPPSRTLDINFSGNNAKRLNEGVGLPNNQDLLPSGFLRNQGVGSWEVNLAGFLGALNTNIWGFSPNDYQYETNFTGSTGIAFSDAERFRRFRQENYRPESADRFFELEAGHGSVTPVRDTFEQDFVDGYSDGPLVVTLQDLRLRLENDQPDNAWSGSDLTNHFTELNNVFSTALNPTAGNPSQTLALRLTGQYTNQSIARTSPRSTYDRYTYYRLISQLGTDSSDGRIETGVHPAYADAYRGRDAVNPFGFYRRAKLNLNYAPDHPEGQGIEAARVTEFRPWQALEWFTNATHRLLLGEFTNGLPFFPPQGNRSVPGLGVHGWTQFRVNNIDYVTNYTYDAQVHRSLQLAANIFDATTNEFLPQSSIAAPTVFRPLVYEDSRSPGILRLHSFEPIFSGRPDFLLQRLWVSPDLVTNGAPRPPGAPFPAATLARSLPESVPPVTSRERGFNVFGLPWVVGAKQGLPNFNQGLWQTIIQPTRRLIITRPTRNANIAPTELPFSGANRGGFRTEYQFIINVTNRVGVEAWNSYLTNFPRAVRIFATNLLEFSLVDETIAGNPAIILQRRELLSTNYVKPAGWPARQYEAPGLTRNTASPAFLQYPLTITNSVLAGLGQPGMTIGTSFIYDPVDRQAFPLTQTNEGRIVISQGNRRFLNPVLSAYVTNSLLFAISDEQTGRLLDIATLRSTMIRTNLIATLGLNPEGTVQEFFQTRAGEQGGQGGQMPAFWSTNLVENNRTRGMDNQMLASIGDIDVPANLWRDPFGASVTVQSRDDAIAGLLYFLYGVEPTGSSADRIRQQYGSNLVVQVGFNPSPRIFMSDRRMANDPLVHYTKDDLAPGYFLVTEAGYTEVPHEFFGLVPGSQLGIQLTTNIAAFDLGPRPKYINAYAPWGTNANWTGLPPPVTAASAALDYGFKDPLIRSSDFWNFPIGTNTSFRFAGVGQLGRIHRGTPWQTIYLKSRVAPELPPNQPTLATRLSGGQLSWGGWAGNRRTHPTNDWKLVDLFTTALNDNAARGQLAVNQPGLAAWAALLSGVPLLENSSPGNLDNPQPLFLRPDRPEITQIVGGYQDRSGQFVAGLVQAYFRTNSGGVLINPDGVFPNLGSILQVPAFSDRAPFLDSRINWAGARNVSDEVLERLPQQVLSLLRADEPRFVIYSYGQTLKPAPSAVNLRPGPLYGIVTNYLITGEYVTKTVVRLDGDPRRLQPVIEDQRVLQANP